MTLTAALEDFYLRCWPRCAALLRKHRGLSNPVLLSPPDGYARQRVRVVVVGKETGPKRWCPDVDVRQLRARTAVKALMSHYDAFQAGTVSGTTHFWRGVRELEDAVGIERGQLVWTNLNKCDLQGGRPRGLETALFDAFPALPEELRLLRPNVVLFVTGPTYDRVVARHLGARLERYGRWPLEVLARVRADELLPAVSFRTYHPNFLLRFRAAVAPGVYRAIRRASRQSSVTS